jgi:mono/diheme cytochrome c family protein
MNTSVINDRRIIVSGLSLLLGLGWCLGAEPQQTAPRVAAPASATTSSTRASPKLEAANRHYRQYCATCHDTDFSGNAWRDQGRDIPDFTNGLWHENRLDAKLVVSILEGKGTRMPSFGQRLSQEEARDLVSLIRQANPAQPESAKSAPSDFESRFGALCEEMEALKKQYRELDNKPPKPGSPSR